MNKSFYYKNDLEKDKGKKEDSEEEKEKEKEKEDSEEEREDVEEEEEKEDEEKLNRPKEKEENENTNNPNNFHMDCRISEKLFTDNFYNNRACIFESHKDNNIYVAYGIKSFDLKGYDIIYDKYFIIKQKLHNKNFDSIRHFYYEREKKDLLITASLDSHVKIINFNKEESEIIIDLNFDSKERRIINTAYFINNFIMVPFANSKNGTVHFYEFKPYSLIKRYEYKGCLQENAGFILGLSQYYCKKDNLYYVLVANLEGIFSYSFDNKANSKLHHKFIPILSEKEKENNGFDEAYVIEKNDSFILIGPCFYYGYLFFWNFFNGDLLSSILIDSGISDICLWNNDYIFASLNHSTSQFSLININTKKIEKNFTVEDEDPRGCGIKVYKNDFKESYLISFSIKGNLDLYSLKE